MEEKLPFTDQIQSSENKHNIPLGKEGIVISPNKMEDPTFENTGCLFFLDPP